MNTTVNFQVVKIAENRFQVNEGRVFVGLRESEAEALATVRKLEAEMREAHPHTEFLFVVEVL